MKRLARALVEAAAFIELSDESVIELHAAVRALEDIATELRECSPAEVAILREVLFEAQACEPEGPGERREFLRKFLSNCGIEE